MKNKRAKLIAKHENPQTSKILKIKIAIGFLIAAAFIYLAWYSYATQISNISEADLLTIKAPTKPIKIKPEDPGGLKINHQDKEIYEHISGRKSVKKERLVKTNTKPASHEKIKQVIRQRHKKQNLKNSTVKPVIIKLPAQQRKTVKKTVKPKRYYLRIAALKSASVKSQAWKLMIKKYPYLKKYQPKISVVKKRGKTIYLLDAGPISSKNTANKICSQIKKTGGKCKLY